MSYFEFDFELREKPEGYRCHQLTEGSSLALAGDEGDACMIDEHDDLSMNEQLSEGSLPFFKLKQRFDEHRLRNEQSREF